MTCSSGYIASAIWGGTCFSILTPYDTQATWDPTYNTTCDEYAYCRQYCQSGCVHCGVDISMPQGTPLYAIDNATVQLAGSTGYYTPLEIMIQTSDGRQYIYGHCSEVDVSVGQVVAAGAFLGRSGHNNSDHLHFEKRSPDGACASGLTTSDPTTDLQNAPLSGGQPAPPPPSPSFRVGEVVQATAGVNLRSGPNTTYGVVKLLATGQQAIVTGAGAIGGGYTWFPLRTPYGDGWAAANYLGEMTTPKNWIADPNGETDLANIYANRTSSPISYVDLYNGHDACTKCVAQGSQTYEGIRYESGSSPLGLTVQRYLVGVVDLAGAGSLDWLTVRAINGDNSTNDSTHPATVNLSSTWQTIVMPTLIAPVSGSGKTVNKIQFHLVRSTAQAQTFYADSCFVYELPAVS